MNNDTFENKISVTKHKKGYTFSYIFPEITKIIIHDFFVGL